MSCACRSISTLTTIQTVQRKDSLIFSCTDCTPKGSIVCNFTQKDYIGSTSIFYHLSARPTHLFVPITNTRLFPCSNRRHKLRSCLGGDCAVHYSFAPVNPIPRCELVMNRPKRTDLSRGANVCLGLLSACQGFGSPKVLSS